MNLEALKNKTIEQNTSDNLYENSQFMNLELLHNREKLKSFVQNLTAKELLHLVIQAKEVQLIEVIFSLQTIQKSLKKDKNDANYNIVTAITTHNLTPESILKTLIKKSNAYVKILISMRNDCDVLMQEMLFEDGDEEVLLSLTYKVTLDKEIAYKLIEKGIYAKSIAMHIKLDNALFDLLLSKYGVDLAKNESLTHYMQEKLLSFHEEGIKLSLASNTHIDEEIIAELLCEGSEDVFFEIYKNTNTPVKKLEEAYENILNHYSLANNENTPQHILMSLGKSDDVRVLMSLAKNKSTPLELLYQLHLDSRFEEVVKKNEAVIGK